MLTSVMTVTGPINTRALGMTLPHEHLFVDLRCQFVEFDDPQQRRLSREWVNSENVAVVRENPYALMDNLLLDDLEVAEQEVQFLKLAGGRTIVDCTPVGIQRDVRKLRTLSQRTDVHIIAGCGYYTFDTHPADMGDRPVEVLTDEILRDLTVGIDGTDIKAGIIGEIGTSDPIHPNEQKVLLASARAFQKTGVAIQVHTYPWGRGGCTAADLLIENQVDPAKIVICHTDVVLDLDYISSLLERGVVIEFDNFGKEFQGDAKRKFASDRERIDVLKRLLDKGYANQLLITNDLCLKAMLHHYGGNGYDHILTNILPRLRQAGLNHQTIDTLLVDNSRNLLISSRPLSKDT